MEEEPSGLVNGIVTIIQSKYSNYVMFLIVNMTLLSRISNWYFNKVKAQRRPNTKINFASAILIQVVYSEIAILYYYMIQTNSKLYFIMFYG